MNINVNILGKEISVPVSEEEESRIREEIRSEMNAQFDANCAIARSDIEKELRNEIENEVRREYESRMFESVKDARKCAVSDMYHEFVNYYVEMYLSGDDELSEEEMKTLFDLLYMKHFNECDDDVDMYNIVDYVISGDLKNDVSNFVEEIISERAKVFEFAINCSGTIYFTVKAHSQEEAEQYLADNFYNTNDILDELGTDMSDLEFDEPECTDELNRDDADLDATDC